MRVTLPLVGPTKQDRSIQCNSQRSVNMFPTIKEPGATADLVLYSHPGLLSYAEAGLGPHRSNALKWKSKLYWVSGAELYSQDSGGNVTLIGTLLTSGTRVVMDGGRNYMGLVDGTYGYTYDGTTFARITDADFPAGPTHIAYQDGYFIVNRSATDEFYISASEDPTSWNALDFTTAAARPDAALAVAAHAKDVYIPGEESTQVYFNSGNADFPFEAYPGAIPIGIDAPHSIAKSAAGLFWLGIAEGGKALVRANGGQADVVSDEEFSWQINQLSNTTDAYAWIRRQGGMSFYEITFPAANRTWSYNIDHNMLSELKSYGLNRFRGAGFGNLGNNYFVADYDDGRIYKLDFDTYTDNGNAFIRKRVTRVIHKEGLGLTFRSLILDCDAGHGLITGQGSTPNVMMRYSVDGGRNWSSELWRSMGAIGKADAKPTWTNLGLGYDWVFEFACSDPVKFNLFNLYADIEVGRS